MSRVEWLRYRDELNARVSSLRGQVLVTFVPGSDLQQDPTGVIIELLEVILGDLNGAQEQARRRATEEAEEQRRAEAAQKQRAHEDAQRRFVDAINSAFRVRISSCGETFSFVQPPKPPSRDWWRVELSLPDGNVTTQQVEAAFRVRVKQTHPDAGGTTEAFNTTMSAKSFALGKASP